MESVICSQPPLDNWNGMVFYEMNYINSNFNHDLIMENDFNEFTEKEEMSTLASCMNKLREDNFKESFVIKANGLGTADSDKTYEPDDVKIVNFYRFEGESDPADNSILYAIETSDGRRGVLTDAYGPYADARVSKFIKEVEDIMKKTTHNEEL